MRTKGDAAVGRQLTLEAILDGLGRALKGQGHCYGITGPSGVGKSHLLEGLERTANDLGFEVLRGSGEPGRRPEEVFSSLLPSLSGPVAGPSLPLLLRERLIERSKKGPLVLTLEDMHWADGATASLLVLLARSVPMLPAMIVLTFDNEWLDAHYGDVNPLVDGLRILGREGAYDELKVEPLDRPRLIKVVEEELLAPLDGSVADFVWERSEGNPMVAIEAARLLVQSRQVELQGGRWRAARTLELGSSDDHSAVARRRLDMLVPEDRETLTVAAVIGRSFDPRVLAKMRGSPLLDILEQLDRIAHDHRILEEDGERYRFSVGAVWRTLLEGLSPARSMEIHGQIAKVLELDMMKEAPLEELSKHYYEAGRKEKCVCFSLLAGQMALDRGDHREAKEHFQKVLDATEKGGYEEERRYSIEGLADAEVALGDIASAETRYEKLLQGPGSEKERGR